MINNTHFAQYLPPTAVNYYFPVTWKAGQVVDTICAYLAWAGGENKFTFPIHIPSNSQGLVGAKLVSVEVDYEITAGEPSSLTWKILKVTRGIEGAVASVEEVTKSQSLTDAQSYVVAKHRQVITVTSPSWTDNDVYYLLEFAVTAPGGGSVVEVLAAVANFTFRA
jgi:hypothetical protein